MITQPCQPAKTAARAMATAPAVWRAQRSCSAGRSTRPASSSPWSHRLLHTSAVAMASLVFRSHATAHVKLAVHHAPARAMLSEMNPRAHGALQAEIGLCVRPGRDLVEVAAGASTSIIAVAEGMGGHGCGWLGARRVVRAVVAAARCCSDTAHLRRRGQRAMTSPRPGVGGSLRMRPSRSEALPLDLAEAFVALDREALSVPMPAGPPISARRRVHRPHARRCARVAGRTRVLAAPWCCAAARTRPEELVGPQLVEGCADRGRRQRDRYACDERSRRRAVRDRARGRRRAARLLAASRPSRTPSSWRSSTLTPMHRLPPSPAPSSPAWATRAAAATRPLRSYGALHSRRDGQHLHPRAASPSPRSASSIG